MGLIRIYNIYDIRPFPYINKNAMNRKSKFVILFSIILIIFMLVSVPTVMAEENNGELEDVNNTVGESISVAIDSSATGIQGEIDKRAFERALNNAESDEERIAIALEQLERLESEVNNIEQAYSSATNEERNGSKASQIARTANKADQANQKLDDIEYVLDNIDADTNESKKKVEELRSELSVSGSESAGVVRDAMLSNGLQVGLRSDINGIDVAAHASGERVFNGMERRSEAHGEFNISESEASDIASEQVEAGEIVNVQELNRGAYEITFEDNGNQTSVVVDARDGEITKKSEKHNVPEHAKENIPNFVFGDDGKIGQGPPQVERGPPEWAGPNNDESEEDKRGPPEHAGPNNDESDNYELPEDDSEDMNNNNTNENANQDVGENNRNDNSNNAEE